MSTAPRDEASGCPVRSEEDLLHVRALLRAEIQRAALGSVAETKLVTAASELARNIIRHSRGGDVVVSRVSGGGRVGVRAVFTDRGPGISTLELAMSDGWSSVGSLGLGLPGAKRLVDDFGIESSAEGTTVTVTMWAR